MAVTFHDINSAVGLKKLDDYLLARSYITGYEASKDDLIVHAALSKPPSSEFVNVSRWYNHITALLRISGVSGQGSGVIVEGSAPITEEAVATPPVADTKASTFLPHLLTAEDDDDDVDLFGEETEEEKKAAEERAASIKASTKKKESGKSSVLLDVKPWDDETDMKKLEEAVRSVHIEGLHWGASKLVAVGYGIKKLQIMLTIVDDLVSVDTLIEEQLTVEPINEYVQSCDIVAFNKIFYLNSYSQFCYVGAWKFVLFAQGFQKGTFETGQEDSTEIPEELKLSLAYREAAVAVLACYFPDPYHPFTEVNSSTVHIKSIRSQPNMRYTEISGKVFSRKSDFVNSIVIKEMNRCCRSFFWGKEGTPPVAWKDVCMPKDQGGLGVKMAKFFNLAALAKLGWKCITDQSNWWVVGNGGSVPFWTSQWVLPFPLLDLIHEHQRGSLNLDQKVADFITNNSWDKIKLAQSELDLLSKALLICWKIWEARNNLLFQDLKPIPASCIHVAASVGLDYWKLNSLPRKGKDFSMMIKWHPPPTGWIKVNFDGSHMNSQAST
ncbi:unnamed protein product [Prunus brigantina]